MNHQTNTREIFDARNHIVLLANPDKIGLLKKMLMNLFTNNSQRDWTPKGWGKGYLTSGNLDTLASTGKSAAIRHQRTKDLSETSIRSLNSIVSLCQAHDLNLFLDIPPAYVSYRDNIDKTVLKKVTEVAEKIQSMHSNVIYMNFFDDLRFSAKDFHDADHLSIQGAEKLSRIISKEISSLEISTTPQ